MIYDVVVIGAGPCGISAVVEAKKSGLSVLLLEKGDAHSQTIRKFYKDGKRVDKAYKGMASDTEGSVEFFDGTKESTLEYFDKLLGEGGFEAKFSCEVEKAVKEGEVFKVATSKGDFEAKNVVVGIGRMGKPNKPDYKIPLALGAVINYNTNSCVKGEKILVVGGGNSAAEYAVDLSETSDVTLCYRREKFSRLNEINEKNVYAAKMTLKLGVDIVEVEESGGKPLVKFGNGESELFDRVVYAIGGSTPVDFLRKCGIEIDSEGKPVADENFQTGIKGLFVGGDIASKNGCSIVVSINNAFRAVKAMAAVK